MGFVNFDDWIRVQLRSDAAAAPPEPRSAPSKPALLSLLREPGSVLQGVVAGVALTFFAFGLLAGVPAPTLRLNLLPTQSQEIPITNLASVPGPAEPAALAVSVLPPLPVRAGADEKLATVSAILPAEEPVTTTEGDNSAGSAAPSAELDRTVPNTVPAEPRDSPRGEPSESAHPEGSSTDGD